MEAGPEVNAQLARGAVGRGGRGLGGLGALHVATPLSDAGKRNSFREEATVSLQKGGNREIRQRWRGEPKRLAKTEIDCKVVNLK